MNDLNDEELMLAFCNNDSTAFEQLYNRYKDSLYRYYLRHINNENYAQELFQDLWLKVINSKNNYQPRAQFKSWLYALARHRLIDWYRRNKLEMNAFEKNILDQSQNIHEGIIDWNPEDELQTRKLGNQLKIAITKLPYEQREVFLLHQESTLTLPEIANLLGEGLEKVKSRYRYAINKLRKNLENVK